MDSKSLRQKKHSRNQQVVIYNTFNIWRKVEKFALLEGGVFRFPNFQKSSSFERAKNARCLNPSLIWYWWIFSARRLIWIVLYVFWKSWKTSKNLLLQLKVAKKEICSKPPFGSSVATIEYFYLAHSNLLNAVYCVTVLQVIKVLSFWNLTKFVRTDDCSFFKFFCRTATKVVLYMYIYGD